MNPGNAGDSLIAAATYQLFDHYNIDVEILSSVAEAKALRNETVLLAGGGNLVPLYHGMSALIRVLQPGNNRIIVLPHSVRGNEELLQSLVPATTIYCRELPTHQHVLAHAPSIEAELSHDLALFLDTDKLYDDMESDAEIHDLFREMLLERAKLTPEAIDGKKMSCMRHGVEKTFIPRAPNFDISIVFQIGVKPREANRGAWMLLEFTRLASEITTNRLHVGVASALSGTTTQLHDNSYGKVSSIYTHSMQKDFPNVSFNGEMMADYVFA
ncbi:polysaccharide pyruvyl transferase family protein [Sphingomonas faeni]|uniref:polysaccharide pyruvyl transferase family protein n=1 Tax=Sphingomonas TaxID=13687 RepID=UPI002FE177B1